MLGLLEKRHFKYSSEATQTSASAQNEAGIAVPILTPRRKPARGGNQHTESQRWGRHQGKAGALIEPSLKLTFCYVVRLREPINLLCGSARLS